MTTRPHRRHRRALASARAGLVVSTIGFCSALVGVAATDADPAAAAPTPGTATIHEGTDAGAGPAIDGGGSDTAFTLVLPAGAACGGDSANDGYRVGSYMVAASVDPSSLGFNPDGPTPSQFGPPQATFAQPLYGTDASPYVIAQTANADPPGGPGQVVNIPNFDFAVFQPAGTGFDVPPGNYNLGIACYIDGPGISPIEEFWNASIAVAADATDTGPAGIAWSVLDPPQPTAVGLEASPAGQAEVGDEVTLSATVTPAEVAGSVVFTVDGVSDSDPVPVAAGVADVVLPELDAGDYTIFATFTPTSADFAPSTSTEIGYAIVPVGTGPTTTTTGAGGTTTTVGGVTPTTATGGGGGGVSNNGLSSLAQTGGSISLLGWSFLMVVFGRIVILLGRKPSVRPA